MNNIDRLAEIRDKKERFVIGLMSGTSLDGLDVALCRIKGSGADTQISLENFYTQEYTQKYRSLVLEVFSKKEINLEKLVLLNEYTGAKHARIINECLDRWQIKASSIDLIGSHGQTVYHAPASMHQQEMFGNATLQVGDADHIAVQTGIVTVADFRQKHIAAGGEGAPLAPYGDLLMFVNRAAKVLLLNLGGISNYALIEKDKPVMSSDIGPGNTLMDAWMQENFSNPPYDKDAFVARQGTVHDGLLSSFLAHPFLAQKFPKSTGPETFNSAFIHEAIKMTGEKISIYDVMATLNALTAQTIADHLNVVLPGGNAEIYVSGGGMHNPLLLQNLRNRLPGAVIKSSDETGINPDAKEAMIFALLANECVAGDPVFFQNSGLLPVTMGKISFPT